jgi:hypothetical protein
MKSASDQLRDDVERNESRSKWAAWVLVAGLVVEVALAFNFSEGKTPLENWSPVLADIMVALGVFGEIHFSGKAARAQKALQSISDGKLAEALDRASKAETALTKLQTPRQLLLAPDEVRAQIIERLRPFAGTKFDVGHARVDRETWDFLWSLEPTIVKAGWIHVDWVGGVIFKKNGWQGDHWYGEANARKVSIEVRPLSRKVLMPAALALAEVLNANGIEAVTYDNNNASQNDDAIHLLVGPKA